MPFDEGVALGREGFCYLGDSYRLLARIETGIRDMETLDMPLEVTV